MFGKIGAGEIILILAIVLIVFGPTKLPALAKSIGQAFNEFRQEKRTDTEGFEKAAECVECGQCEDICPQKLPIRELLKQVAETFEKNPV